MLIPEWDSGGFFGDIHSIQDSWSSVRYAVTLREKKLIKEKLEGEVF